MINEAIDVWWIFIWIVLFYFGIKSIVQLLKTTPFEKGQNALIDGMKLTDNPYNKEKELENFTRWNEGFDCDWLLDE